MNFDMREMAFYLKYKIQIADTSHGLVLGRKYFLFRFRGMRRKITRTTTQVLRLVQLEKSPNSWH